MMTERYGELADILVELQRINGSLGDWRRAVPASELPYPCLMDDAVNAIQEASSSIAECLVHNMAPPAA